MDTYAGEVIFDRAIRFDGPERVIRTNERDQIWLLKTIPVFMNLVERSTGNHFSIGSLYRNEYVRLKASPLGLQLLGLLKYDLESLWNCYPIHVFHPYIVVFKRILSRRGLLIKGYINFPLLEAEQKKIVFLLNRIFYWMRYVCNHKKFQERTRVHKNNVQQNIRSCLNYLIAHFNQHSRLLILRIDLHFLQKCIHKATAEDNRKALDKFLRALREGRIVESVVAYISVTEYGYHRGFHQHVLIALNSNEHQRGIYWARVIGEYWQQCTNGQGSYFDCFALKEKYRHCGIGMIHISETEKLQGLRNAVLYMLKGDYYVKIAAKNERILRKGIMPIPKNKRGAPRQKPEDTLNMEKVLRGKSLHNKP